MKHHEFKHDIIYKEIVSIAEQNDGVIDEEMIIRNLEERAIHVTPGVIQSRISYYLENAPKTNNNHKKTR